MPSASATATSSVRFDNGVNGMCPATASVGGPIDARNSARRSASSMSSAIEHLDREVAALVDETEQDVLGADVVVRHLASRVLRERQRLAGARREPPEHAEPGVISGRG